MRERTLFIVNNFVIPKNPVLPRAGEAKRSPPQSGRPRLSLGAPELDRQRASRFHSSSRRSVHTTTAKATTTLPNSIARLSHTCLRGAIPARDFSRTLTK